MKDHKQRYFYLWRRYDLPKKMNDMDCIVITGVTGLLGRNLLFEILKQNTHRIDDLTIFLTGRKKHGKTIAERVIEIYDAEGQVYLSISDSQNQEIRDYIKHKIQYIGFDLLNDAVIPDVNDLKKIQSTSIDYFFHLAALPDLKNDNRTAKRTYETNVNGTKNVLKLIKTLDLKEFDFVGTAYAAGKATGNILPTYGNLEGEFRNPYEKSKLIAENLVKEFALKSSVRCRYFRPSIVCGRLIESLLGCTSKFDVFYTLFSFLWMAKFYHLRTKQNLQSEFVDIGLRAVFDTNSGQNIVPVDYVVKLLYQICTKNHPEDSFHLVNDQNMSFTTFLEVASQVMNFTGVQAVHKIPDSLNVIEQMYYQKADIFQDYLLTDAFHFDTSNVSQIAQASNLVCPPIDKQAARQLMTYAVSKNFGLDLDRVAHRFQRMGLWQ